MPKRKTHAAPNLFCQGLLAIDAGWQATTGRLGFLGAVLFFAFFVWVEIAFLPLMMFLGLGGAALPPSSEFMQTLLFTSAGQGHLVTGTLTGAAFGMIVFSISAVAVPLLLVKDVDVVAAMATSARSVGHKYRPDVALGRSHCQLDGAGFHDAVLGSRSCVPARRPRDVARVPGPPDH